MDQQRKLSLRVRPHYSDLYIYQLLVDRLLYLTSTRLDRQVSYYYVVYVLSQFMHDPRQPWRQLLE